MNVTVNSSEEKAEMYIYFFIDNTAEMKGNISQI